MDVPGMSETRRGAIFIGLTCVVLISAGFMQDTIRTDPIFYWSIFKHESGRSTYYIREDSVIGILEWDEDSTARLGYRTELLLSNGRIVHTKMTLEEVESQLQYLRDGPGDRR